MRLLTAALVAAFLCPPPALAQPCQGLAEIEIAVANTPYAEIAHDLRGPDAVAWIATFNAIPEITAFFADQVVIVDSRPRQAVVYVWLLIDDCIVDAWPISRALYERVTDDVLGVPHTVFKER